MLYASEREQLLDILWSLKTYQLIDCSGGALSLRCGEHILITTTGSAFRRWQLGPTDFIVLDADGGVVERSDRLGPAGTPIHLALYHLFPACGAVIHAHSPYSLAFAARGRTIPSETNLLDTLGEVPCLVADDRTVKSEVREAGVAVEVPAGVVQRPDVYAINTRYLIPQLANVLLHRRDELGRHGLTFTVYRHGVFAFARSADEAFENLVRVETSARTHILARVIDRAGLDERVGQPTADRGE